MLRLKKNPILLGTLILSFSGLLCRGMGFFYRLFISKAFGEEAMGIFQLTSPVLILAFSITGAGIQTAISRYTAYCMAKNNPVLAKKYMFCGCSLSLLLSLLYSVIIYLQAENISIYILQEARCTPLLRICSLSFPFSALHSCFNGYFYGRKNTVIPSFSQIVEQFMRVGTVLLIYQYFISTQKIPTIAITCIGMFVGEVSSFLICFFYYCYLEQKQVPLSKSAPLFHEDLPSGTILKQLLELALPLTLNRVIVNSLQSYEAVSLPSRLQVYGYSAETALSIYGVLTGMAFSLILFPSTFANSASVLLLPGISEAASRQNSKQIRRIIKQSVFFSCVLGCFFAFVFFSFGTFFGNLLFSSTLAGTFIRQLSFFSPFLYLHTTLSGILNGLKKTGITLLINISSLLIRLFFTLYLVPEYGIQSYLSGLLLSELCSSLLCFYFLKEYLFTEK